jgi:hypothetical protein
MPVYRYEMISKNNSEHAFGQQLCSCNFHVHVLRAERWDANHRLFHMERQADRSRNMLTVGPDLGWKLNPITMGLR